MPITDLYTPNITLLSKMGVTLASFQPEESAQHALLCRTSLERCLVTSPLSYYRAEQSGMGLLRLDSGSLVYTVFRTDLPVSPSPSSPAADTAPSPSCTVGFPRRAALPTELSTSLSGKCFFLFDSSKSHRIQILRSAQYELLYFTGSTLPYFAEHLFEEAPFRIFTPSAEGTSELPVLFENKEKNPILCHMLLTDLLSRAVLERMPPARNIPSYLRAIKEELETQYYRKYTLEDLELDYKKNKYRICREFKEYYQIPPLQYLHRMRIQAAKDLLIETDMKVHEISYEVGYENANHFIAHFKKITGITPSEYRSRV